VKRKREVTILVIPEGSTKTYGKKFSFATLWVLLAAVLLVAATFVFMVVNYSKVYYTALQVEILRHRNQKLEDQWRKIVEIESDLVSIRNTDQQIRKMLGTEQSPASLTPATSNAPDLFEQRGISLGGPSSAPAQPDSGEGPSTSIDMIPTIWPVRGWLSRLYTPEHSAVDIAAPTGTPVVATTSGKVTRAGWSDRYGRIIEIENDQGFGTMYGHNSRLLVKEGEVVSQGDVIAFVGSTGLSSAPHLHYEIRVKGKPVDPMRYLVH
jgi:murein DD-endopeptidase MepM/ murein hydrolase activator NlpD